MNSSITPSPYIVAPQVGRSDLVTPVKGLDETGSPIKLDVINERPLTLYLNAREIVTMMTIGDHPEWLAIGYLANQNMLPVTVNVTGVDVDEEIGVVVVRTDSDTPFEEKMSKRVRTSGCAQGTVFGDVFESFENVSLKADARLKTTWLQKLSKTINTTPSLYLSAGAIHGCVLCKEDRPLVYMEDVGRHNAVDKVAGWMRENSVSGADKIFYTTGRLTSEMVIKTVMMGIPILVSRSGFTAWGVELAKQAGLTLIGRAKGNRFMVLAGADRIEFDSQPFERAHEGKERGKK